MPAPARRPTTSEPGSTGRRFSSSTAVAGSTVKRAAPAPAASSAPADREPARPVSDEPNASITMTPGRSSPICFFVDVERMAPPDARTMSDDRS